MVWGGQETIDPDSNVGRSMRLWSRGAVVARPSGKCNGNSLVSGHEFGARDGSVHQVGRALPSYMKVIGFGPRI
jgi:hypothetical protein